MMTNLLDTKNRRNIKVNQHNKPTIYWTLVSHNSWNIYIAATSTGLCFVGAQNGTFAELSQWAKKKYLDVTLRKIANNLNHI